MDTKVKNMNDYLKNSVDQFTLETFLSAEEDFTKWAMQLQVAKFTLRHLEITKKDLEFLLNPATVFIHPQVSKYLREGFPADSFFDEKGQLLKIVLKIYSADYHALSDVEEFADLFDYEIQDPDQRHMVNIAFAVDGFRGKNLKNYVDNLGREMREVPHGERDWEKEDRGPMMEHVRVVRYLYKKNGPVKVDLMNMAIQNAFDQTASSNYTVQKLTKEYIWSMGEQNLEKAKKFIETNYICFSEKP